MNENYIIKYENVKNESYQMIHFNRNNKIEILLVHGFETDRGQDYIVVGKSMVSISAANKEGPTWCNLISEVVSTYKNARTILEDNEKIYNKVGNIPDFYFTKEGYDLITNRHSYTNHEISRTVGLISASNSSYKDYTVLQYGIDYAFMDFSYLEKIYILRPEDFEKMNFLNMMSFVGANLNKVKNFINFNDNYSDYVRSSLFNYSGVSISTNGLEFLKSVVNVIDEYNYIKKGNIDIKKK